MQLQEETISETYPVLDDIVREYFAKTVAAQDVPPIDFNWPAYSALNEQSLVRLFTARDGDEILGFALYFVSPHMHHHSVMNAACDTLAVRLSARGRGVGRALMAHAEPILKNLGVKYIMHHFRTCYKTKPLFPKLGYKLVEYGYMKELS